MRTIHFLILTLLNSATLIVLVVRAIRALDRQ